MPLMVKMSTTYLINGRRGSNPDLLNTRFSGFGQNCIYEIRCNNLSDDETLIDQKITYTLEMDGNLFIIKNVPARVNLETGEQLFSPETIDRLQQIVWTRAATYSNMLHYLYTSLQN